MAREHILNISLIDNAEVVALADPHENSLNQCNEILKTKVYCFKNHLEMIEKRTESGTLNDGILRDNDGGKIVLFDKIIPGQGTDGTSYPTNHTLSYTGGYFKYEENEETSKIIKREFTEL